MYVVPLLKKVLFLLLLQYLLKQKYLHPIQLWLYDLPVLTHILFYIRQYPIQYWANLRNDDTIMRNAKFLWNLSFCVAAYNKGARRREQAWVRSRAPSGKWGSPSPGSASTEQSFSIEQGRTGKEKGTKDRKRCRRRKLSALHLSLSALWRIKEIQCEKATKVLIIIYCWLTEAILFIHLNLFQVGFSRK